MPETRNPWQFGHIEGFPVGYRWKDRQKLSDDGVHAPVRAGIHGRQDTGAFSLVLSGGYEDNHCDGNEFIYTGSGGNTFSLSLKQLVQVSDQQWKRGNRALQTSMKLNKPVRVIRGYGLKSKFAPAAGYRYDGLYKVVSATIKPGKNGHLVCLFEMKRCPDQPPLPVSPALLASSNSRVSPDPESEDDVEIVSTNFASTSAQAESSGSLNTATSPTVVESPPKGPVSTPSSQQAVPESASAPSTSSSQVHLPTPAPDGIVLTGRPPSSSSLTQAGSSATLVASPPASWTGPSPRCDSPPSTPVASSSRVQLPQKRPRPRPITSPDRWAKRAKIASFEECLQSDDRDFVPTPPIAIRPAVGVGAASPPRNLSGCTTARRGSGGTECAKEREESLERDGIQQVHVIKEEPGDFIDLSGTSSSLSKGKGKAGRFLGVIDLTLESDDEGEGGDMSSPTCIARGGERAKAVKQEEVQVHHLGFVDLTLESDEEMES
ncbi:unnamed protein product [Cyclocybe aegerita]|uniref:YDG domain-containing protein n=1 Tax=Cyclocybe aegerita TaxID=1973307 RepID=A0A8S0WFP1_CYCAE|nr:unnamed protein product [Cyclocybe aegerita]